MPFYRVPGRVGAFKKWAAGKVDSAELSDSATPKGMSFRHKRRRKRRARRRKRSQQKEE